MTEISVSLVLRVTVAVRIVVFPVAGAFYQGEAGSAIMARRPFETVAVRHRFAVRGRYLT